MSSLSNAKNPAAKVALKVPYPDSLVEVRVSPPESNFEVKVSPGEEFIELIIRPGASLIEVRISPPSSCLASCLDLESSFGNKPVEDLVLDKEAEPVRENFCGAEEGPPEENFCPYSAIAKEQVSSTPITPAYELPHDVKRILERGQESQLPELEVSLNEETGSFETGRVDLAVDRVEIQAGLSDLNGEIQMESTPFLPEADEPGPSFRASGEAVTAAPPVDDVSILIEDHDETPVLDICSENYPASDSEEDIYPRFEIGEPENDHPAFNPVGELLKASEAKSRAAFEPQAPAIGFDESFLSLPEETDKAPVFEPLLDEPVGAAPDRSGEKSEVIGPAARDALARLSAVACEEGASFNDDPQDIKNADSTLMVTMYADSELAMVSASETRSPVSEDEMMDLGPVQGADEELALGLMDIPDLENVDLDQSRSAGSDLDKSVVKARPLIKVNPANTIVPQ